MHRVEVHQISIFNPLMTTLLFLVQEDVGDLLPVEIAPPGTSCEYWVHENFQTCLELKKPWASRNIYLIDGKFYERGTCIHFWSVDVFVVRIGYLLDFAAIPPKFHYISRQY